MTELELYKFITKYNVEYHRYEDKIYMMIDIYIIDEFNNLFEATIFDEEGISCIMKDGYFTFEMTDICEYYGLNIGNIFINKEY